MNGNRVMRSKLLVVLALVIVCDCVIGMTSSCAQRPKTTKVKRTVKHYKEVNPTIGKTTREHFDLRNDKTILVNGQCKLIKNYMRFHEKA